MENSGNPDGGAKASLYNVLFKHKRSGLYKTQVWDVHIGIKSEVKFGYYCY